MVKMMLDVSYPTLLVRMEGLLMAEILHQLSLVGYPIVYRFYSALYISGGAGFLPSTVWREHLEDHPSYCSKWLVLTMLNV